MEFYDDWMLGIDWFEYEIMYPDERRSPYINRFMEINMLQMVLEKGLQKMEPFSLNDFWETTVEQEKWNGRWETFRNHFKDNIGKQVETLIFIPIKYRALILYVTSMRVSEEFKIKKLRSNDKPKCEKKKEEEEESEQQVKTIGPFTIR
ncbi:hypothetical protein CRE_28960 [Caenorhabditis remanei]|uniref:SPK domain-containing protein n=1 Tax=Caenorhabditis remanei TaxID=31234 RepID=E3N5F4_CAERE|nr:hypothetical protein CRE_28960 [Caenorhabditis remanei]